MALLSEEVQKELENAAYLAVGFGVLAFQQAQVQRRELERQLRRLLSCGGRP